MVRLYIELKIISYSIEKLPGVFTMSFLVVNKKAYAQIVIKFKT